MQPLLSSWVVSGTKTSLSICVSFTWVEKHLIGGVMEIMPSYINFFYLVLSKIAVIRQARTPLYQKEKVHSARTTP